MAVSMQQLKLSNHWITQGLLFIIFNLILYQSDQSLLGFIINSEAMKDALLFSKMEKIKDITSSHILLNMPL